MATGSVLLPVGAAILPDGSTNNLAPAVQRVKGSAANPTPFFLQLAFDASSDEFCMWSFRMPADYASGPILKVQFKMVSAITGNVVILCRVAAITPGDATDADAKAFGSANTSAATAVPATTAGKIGEISLTLTNNDSLAANDFVIVRLTRLGSDAGDTAAGDMEVVAVSLEYTTA
jgi:hypothetical protein